MPGRNSRARGRFFPIDYDLGRINRDVEQEQEESGTFVDWWIYDSVNSSGGPYGEGGRRWTGPNRIPVIDARRIPGQLLDGTAGKYTLDKLVLRLNYEQARLAGLLPNAQDNTEAHLSDRIVYMNRVFNIGTIDVEGQFDEENTEVVMRVECTQVRPDALVDDVDFLAFSS